MKEVQKPEIVEVGKLHKLRILLRNETVTWVEFFISVGGMDELVKLLYRILKVEWRLVPFSDILDPRVLIGRNQRGARRSTSARGFTLSKSHLYDNACSPKTV